MIEWVLLLTLNLVPTPTEMRDVSVTTLSGFTSAVSCESAGKALAERTIAVVGRAREQRGIRGGSMVMSPSINYECVQIRK